MKKKIKKLLFNYLLIIIGTLITATGLVVFLIPGKIASGGVSGFAVIVFHLFEIPVGLTIMMVNVPLLLMSFKILGYQSGIKTVFGVVFLSLFVEALAPVFPSITEDPLLASVYGGVLAGFGMGLIFKTGGTTGGTDLIASLINYFFPQISIGQGLFIVDALVVTMAGFVFNAELALYAAFAIFIVSRLIDFVQEGFSFTKAIMVVSEEAEIIREKILKEVDRGVTVLKGKGGYTGEDKNILFVTVNRSELAGLKKVIYGVDPDSFVILMDAHEVVGEGFKKWD